MIGQQPENGGQQHARERESRNQPADFLRRYAELLDNRGKGRGDAGHPQDRHQGYAKNDLKVRVSIDRTWSAPSRCIALAAHPLCASPLFMSPPPPASAQQSPASRLAPTYLFFSPL